MFTNFDSRVNQSVTAGLPSLSPEKRSGFDRKVGTRALSDHLISEQEARDKQALVIDSTEDATNLTARLGRPLHASQFIEKLKKLNPSLVFERSINYPRLTGIYIEQTVTELEKALGAESKRHVCGMESEWMPEFSQSHYKTESVPNVKNPGEMILKKKFVGETRGWRTVLARLIREKLISLPAVEVEFNIPQGKSSFNWKELTT